MVFNGKLNQSQTDVVSLGLHCHWINPNVNICRGQDSWQGGRDYCYHCFFAEGSKKIDSRSDHAWGRLMTHKPSVHEWSLLAHKSSLTLFTFWEKSVQLQGLQTTLTTFTLENSKYYISCIWYYGRRTLLIMGDNGGKFNNTSNLSIWSYPYYGI